MSDISSSSQKISEIIGVIDSIAFQTNFLALNAAVEAARAGKQGRGFAVVASEVRALAQRSAGAAKEIKTLILASAEKVETGSGLVGSAGEANSNVVAQVRRVNDLVGEISAASLEQSQGIGQIGDAVAQLDQVTQSNAALVEQSAAAAESLRHQARRLAEAMAIFKIAGEKSTPASVPVPRMMAKPDLRVAASSAPKRVRESVVKAAPPKAPAPKQVELTAAKDDWADF